MRKTIFLVFVSTLETIMSITISQTTRAELSGTVLNSPQASVHANVTGGEYKRQFKRGCPVITTELRKDCFRRAQNVGSLNDNVHDDLDFFKQCIVDYYCFEKSATADIWIKQPSLRGDIASTYFALVAKRVEMFFIQNNYWSRTVVHHDFRDISTGQCTNLLYVTAARYLYVTHVLNMLSGEMTFGPCDVDSTNGNLVVPSAGVCFPLPHGSATCTSDHDVGLLGARSGFLAAVFSQFFRETGSRDPIVVGFGKSSEELLNTNVYAFTLEFAMPGMYSGLSAQFVSRVNAMNGKLKYIVQEVVAAIQKMYAQNVNYYNDFTGDQGEFKKRATKHNLLKMFRAWRTKFQKFRHVVKSLLSSDNYATQIGFRRQLNIAYEMIAGTFEMTEGAGVASKAMSEVAMAITYHAEAYHTRGAIRHVVGWTQMQRRDVFDATTVNDYWVSMLENWADAIKEYNRECAKPRLVITACLPKMSKFMWRMLDAMHAIRSRLGPKLRENLFEVDNAEDTGVRSIMSHWLTEVKKKGLAGIPRDDRLYNLAQGTTNLDIFLEEFKCSGHDKTAPLSQSCVDSIQETIRQYNRNMYINLVYMSDAM